MAWQSPRGPMSIDPETRDVDPDRLHPRGQEGRRQAAERDHRRDPGREGSAARRRQVTDSPAGPARFDRDRPARHRPVRRLRLRDAAVRPVGGAVGHAGVDELHQPRARRLRHARRLRRRRRHAPARACRSSPPCRLAFLAAALVSIVFERTLFRRLYRAGELNQVLFTIGLVFVAAAAAAYVFGTGQQPIQLPAFLRGSVEIRRHALRRLPALPHRRGAADHGAARLRPGAHALRRAGPRRGRQPARRAGARTRRRHASSPSPSRSAAALPGSAARWRSRSSASIRPSAFTTSSTC